MAVGKAIGKDVCSCYERLPKPLTGQVDLWSTRVTGRRQRLNPVSCTFVEQSFQVHTGSSLKNVQMLWASTQEMPLTARVAGMCKSGGAETCRDQSLMETQARLSASLTPRATQRKEAAPRDAEDAEVEKSDAETEEAWADAQGKGAPGQDRGAIELTPRRAATASLAQVKVCMEEV